MLKSFSGFERILLFLSIHTVQNFTALINSAVQAQAFHFTSQRGLPVCERVRPYYS